MTTFRAVPTVLLLAFLAVGLCGCAPTGFVRTMEPHWASVELRSDLDYEKAWASCIDLLIKRFDMEMLSKEDGYARTCWLYTWTGQPTQSYRVRVTLKFTPDKKVIQVKCEAEWRDPGGNWIGGYDSRLVETLKTDLMGSLGRTTR